MCIFCLIKRSKCLLINTERKEEAVKNAGNLLEKHLSAFVSDKTKENYVRLLQAFRCTDVLVLSGAEKAGNTLVNDGRSAAAGAFRPDIVYFADLKMHLMPLFSSEDKIPPHTGKAVFMHCNDWINLFRLRKSDGIILNPRSTPSFVLTADQIKVLALFKEDGRRF